MEISLCFSTKRLCFAACWFSFMLRWNTCLWIKLRCDSEIPCQNLFEAGNQLNAGALSQSPSGNHALLITKVPLWLRKTNALCLSQSTFSNFALYVITEKNRSCTETRLNSSHNKYSKQHYKQRWKVNLSSEDIPSVSVSEEQIEKLTLGQLRFWLKVTI